MLTIPGNSEVFFVTINPRCRFCHNSDPSEALRVICSCGPPSNYGHTDCLLRAVRNQLSSSHCPVCGDPYRGILVEVKRPGCGEWIKKDSRARWDLLLSPLVVIYLFYLSYLGHICYITNYWDTNPLIRYLLVNMSNLILYLSITSAIVALVKIAVDYEDWKRRNTEVIASALENRTHEMQTAV